MGRSLRVTIIVVANVLIGTPALAQLPNIFDTLFGPPSQRPPGDIPRSNLPPPGDYPGADVPPPQPLPPGSPPPYSGPRAPVQSQPLPPPPGAVTAPPAANAPRDPRAPQNAQIPIAPAPALPPGQRPPGTPTSVPPQPDDEVVTQPPAVKVPNPTAVFAGLDKITGRITTFDVAINETVRFGALEVTPRACYTRLATEAVNTDGFVEVDELTLQGELRRIFTGWMFASSPGLNAVEHPIYDVWLTDCKGAQQAPIAEVAPDTPPPAAQRPPARRPPPPPPPPPQRRATAPAQPLPPPPVR